MSLILSFTLAILTSFLLLFLCLPLSYVLERKQFAGKFFIESLVALPTILPPVILGLAFLLLFSPYTAFGSWFLETFGFQLTFSFSGLVIVCTVAALPSMLSALQDGWRTLDPNLAYSSYFLGRKRLETFLFILLPNLAPSILSGFLLSFAKTLGQFGLVMMVGGNIPGSTRVISLDIYHSVEALDLTKAMSQSLLLLIISFGIIVSLNGLKRKSQ